MSRKPKNVEFICTLQKISKLNVNQFARACGKAQPNMHNYINGNVIPKESALRSAAEHYFSWSLRTIAEMVQLPENKNNISTEPGLYAFYDSGRKLLYFGKATNLRNEIRQTLRRQIPISLRVYRAGTLRNARPTFESLTKYYSAYSIKNRRVRHNLEALVLRIISNSTYNSNVGNFI